MVYFLQAVEGGPIKIGFTENFEVRLKQLETAYGQPLALLRVVPGGRIEEHDIHQRFAHLRLRRTEQFRPDPELLDFIGRPLFVSAQPVVEPMETKGPLLIATACTIAYKQWAERGADYLRTDVSKLADAALVHYLEAKGFPEKPPRR